MVAQNLCLLLAGLDFHQKQSLKQSLWVGTRAAGLTLSASHGGPAHVRLVLWLAWLRAGAADGPGTHSVYCFVTFSDG